MYNREIQYIQELIALRGKKIWKVRWMKMGDKGLCLGVGGENRNPPLESMMVDLVTTECSASNS